MSDITLTTITSGYNISKINANFTTLQDAINNDRLQTAGGGNTMSQTLDMDGNEIINIASSNNPTSVATKQDITDQQNYTDNAVAGVVGGYGYFQQNGIGTVGRTFQDKQRDEYNVFDLFTPDQKADALSGNPTIDTTSIIQQALDNAASFGQVCKAYGTFRTSGTLVIKGNVDFSQAKFNVYGSPACAFEVSTGSSSNPTDILSNVVVRLPKQTTNMNKPTLGWAGQGVGIRLVNLYSCEVHFGHVQGFATNVLVTSFGGVGNVYNEYHCDQLDNGMVNLQLSPGDSASWVNENLFIGGRFGHNSGEGTNVTGVRHILISASTQLVNNNLFLKPSVEANVPEYHVENAGTANTFLQARWEALPPKVLYSGPDSGNGSYNTILYGYNAHTIIVSTSGYTGSRFNQIKTAYNKNVTVSGINSYTDFVSNSINVTTYHGDGSGLQLKNQSSDSYACQYIFSSGIASNATTNANYNVRMGANFFGFKDRNDSFDRIQITPTSGYIYFGTGSATPTARLGALSGGITSNVGIGMWSQTAPSTKPVVTGSKASNAALASLITALASYGIISDSTT